MIGINDELEKLYIKAQQDGQAVIKDRWTSGNYGCCSTRAPLVEKYKIENRDHEHSFYIWGTLAVTTDSLSNIVNINRDYEASNYDKKIITWFIQRSETE
ncbi:hypothetical protein IGI39_000994 [Enterococcus sp. AZ135]|uniref:hypothetical protein n=1 Tax=unclassified Enterococcus TaxID=2608891 RepID=UPI003F250E02